MPKAVPLMTVQEAGVQLLDRSNQGQVLDSGKYGAVGSLAFNAEACELANLFTHVSQLCQKPNLPTNCTGPHSSSIEDTFWI